LGRGALLPHGVGEPRAHRCVCHRAQRDGGGHHAPRCQQERARARLRRADQGRPARSVRNRGAAQDRCREPDRVHRHARFRRRRSGGRPASAALRDAARRCGLPPMMRRLAWVLAGSLAGWPAYAQIVPPAADPGAIQQRQIEDEQRRRALERLERKPVTEPLERPEVQKRAPKAAPKAIRFKVNAIEFSASEILAAAELEAIARDYRGREISLAELQELAERVNDLYRAKGVVTARAVIPPQDVSDGVVRIRLVEGRYGELSLRGNENTSAGYVTWRRGQTPGSLVDL